MLSELLHSLNRFYFSYNLFILTGVQGGRKTPSVRAGTDSPLCDSYIPLFSRTPLMPDVGLRFRAYTDERTLRALKAQSKLASGVYNTLRWADVYFHGRDGKGLNKTELRQLALDLRKQDEHYRKLYSQTLQQIADRFYDARQRFLDGLARFPKEKRAHRWHPGLPPLRLESPEGKRNKERGEQEGNLELSNLGIFKLVLHRDFPERES